MIGWVGLRLPMLSCRKIQPRRAHSCILAVLRLLIYHLSFSRTLRDLEQIEESLIIIALSA